MIALGQWAARHVLDARGEHPESAWGASILAGCEELERGPRMALVLIHGFANTCDEAAVSYHALLRNLEDVASSGGGRSARLADIVDVFAFHWPGDHPGDRVDDALSAAKLRNLASFAVRVPAADGAGRLLAGALIQTRRERVVVVAHSLGCRVALSALADLHARVVGEAEAAAPRIHLVLMAAAVPVDECTSGAFARERQPDAARCSVLYSPRDRVLRYAFPPGQAVVDRSAEAVGLRGRPEQGRWHGSLKTGNGHGGYWDSAETARQVLGVLAHDELRRVGARSLGLLPSLLPPAPTAARILPERRLPERRLPTRIGAPPG